MSFIIDPYRYLIPALFDTYGGAVIGYSLKKLSNSYSGNCIRVRRSSDNAEQNIGFVSNILDTVSLLAFCGAGNGFITTWYDQSGNNNNATQTTASLQPQIVSSGNIVTISSIYTIDFATSINQLNGLDVPSLSTLTQGESFMVVRVKNDPPIGANSGFINFGTSGSNIHFPWESGNIFDDFGCNTRRDTGNPATTLAQWNLYGVLTKTNNWTSRLNGTQLFTTGTNTVSFSSTPKLGSKIAAGGMNNYITEFILYPSDQATNRTGIQNFIKNSYNLP